MSYLKGVGYVSATEGRRLAPADVPEWLTTMAANSPGDVAELDWNAFQALNLKLGKEAGEDNSRDLASLRWNWLKDWRKASRGAASSTARPVSAAEEDEAPREERLLSFSQFQRSDARSLELSSPASLPFFKLSAWNEFQSNSAASPEGLAAIRLSHSGTSSGARRRPSVCLLYTSTLPTTPYV